MLAHNPMKEILVNLEILQPEIQEELKTKQGLRRVLKFIQTAKSWPQKVDGEMNKNDKQ